MNKEFEDLLGQYWDLAHLEGKSGVSQGDKANEVLHALKKLAEQPAQQQEWIEAACALIKAADDAAADNDYMLDCDDCIKVLRGEWKGHLMNDQPTAPQPAQHKPFTHYRHYDNGLQDWADEKTIPLYTSPPASKPWVGLTEAEEVEAASAPNRAMAVKNAASKLQEKNESATEAQRKPLTRQQCLYLEVHPRMTIEQVVRVVEAAHGIKENT